MAFPLPPPLDPNAIDESFQRFHDWMVNNSAPYSTIYRIVSLSPMTADQENKYLLHAFATLFIEEQNRALKDIEQFGHRMGGRS